MGMLVAQGSTPIGVGTNRLPPPVPVRTGFWPSLALPRSTPSLTWPSMGEAKEVERGAVRIRMAYAPRPMNAKVDDLSRLTTQPFLPREERPLLPRRTYP